VVEPLGAETFVHIDTGEETVVATTSGRNGPQVGAAVRATATADVLCYFDSTTEKAI
jgi:multiple sugar transport system ATP-binding protein